MMYTGQTCATRRRSMLRCYRSTALSTGSSGTLVVLPWDAESSLPTKSSFTHSTSSSPENITCDVAGDYEIRGAVKLVAGTWNELRGSLEVNGTPIYTPNCGASGGLLGLSPGPSTLVIASPSIRLARNDIVRLRIASVAQGSVSLDVGETDTWLEIFSL